MKMKLGLHLSRGFTLIELMVAVAVTAILATIAVTSYSSFVLRAHRAEIKSALLDMASLEERFLSTNPCYTGTATDLGYPAGWTGVVGSGYYQVQLPIGFTCGSVATATPASFTITAAAIGNQAKDTACATFIVTSTGARTAFTQGAADNTATCW
jgi:type IV pilus assembly protein PilE